MTKAAVETKQHQKSKPLTVWVTRPGLAGQAWTQALQEAGFDAHSQPLLALSAMQDTRAIEAIGASWQNLNDYAALMFVSAAAVEYFFQAQPVSTADSGPCFSKPRFWAPGEGTRQALLKQGVSPTQVDSPNVEEGRFDSETLWSLVQSQVPFSNANPDNQGEQETAKKYLLVGGADAQGKAQGREYLASMLGQRGAQWESLLVYQRLIVPPITPLRTGVWLLSSSLSLEALEANVWGAATALCTHPRIAKTARQWGFGQVLQTQSRIHAIVSSLERIAKG